MRRCYRGFWFGPEDVLKKTLLTGPKFNLNTSSKKKIVEGGGVHPLYARRVNRVKDALPLNSEFFSKSFSLF